MPFLREREAASCQSVVGLGEKLTAFCGVLLSLGLGFHLGDELFVGLLSRSVFPFGLQGLTHIEKGSGVGAAVAQRVAVGRGRAGRHAKLGIAESHLIGHGAALGALFALGQLVVDLAVGFLGLEVFATFELLVGNRELGAAASAEHGRSHQQENPCRQPGFNIVKVSHLWIFACFAQFRFACLFRAI